MKEMMLRLPMVEVSASEDLWQAKLWSKNGRYIVRRDDGCTSVVEVQLKPTETSEDDEADRLRMLCEVFVGCPTLYDPDNLVLATDYDNAKNALAANREHYEARLAEMNTQIERLKEEAELALAEKEKECKALIDEKEAEYNSRYSALNENYEQKLQKRLAELDHEYETKKLKLELETPKRFAQGEWVSGKTLTEIIKTLAGGKKEE